MLKYLAYSKTMSMLGVKKILHLKFAKLRLNWYFRKILMIKKTFRHEFYIYNKFDIILKYYKKVYIRNI